MRRVVNYGVLDQFKFGNTMRRELTDYVYLDIMNEKEDDALKIEQVAKYINDTFHKINSEKTIVKMIIGNE